MVIYVCDTHKDRACIAITEKPLKFPNYHLDKFSIDNMETSAGGDRYSRLRWKDKVVYYVIVWVLVL